MKRILFLVAAYAVMAAVNAPAAFGATAITQPSSSPYHVTVDAQGKPVPFTVVASGFPFRGPVFVEQCDGKVPGSANWSPTNDCDLATGQAPAYADAKGVATFDAADSSRAFRPFVGPSPQQIFNCVAPGAKAPDNNLPTFDNCQLRVSSNVTKATDDQVFLPLTFGAAGATSSSSSSTIWVLAALGVIVVIALVAWLVVRSRRKPAPKAGTRATRERSAPRR